VSQQSTGRAQYRGTVSQALERIRQAARQRKKEKFTALFHHVSIDHLAEAFSELKENAAAGVDGLTCRDYEQHLERNLEDLQAQTIIAISRDRALEADQILVRGVQRCDIINHTVGDANSVGRWQCWWGPRDENVLLKNDDPISHHLGREN
jgi:hypothetical protein